MKLREILSKHDFHLATEKEDCELQEIFEQIPMGIGEILFYTQRRPSYFSFTNLRSNRNFTFWTRDSVTNRIVSVGCLSLRHGYLNGEKVTLGFFGDMRSQFNRETSKKWRGFYGDLIQQGSQCEELNFCKYFYTTIFGQNRRAIQAYVGHRRNPFRYLPLSTCKIVNIFGRLRGSNASLALPRGWKIRLAKPQDLEPICDFLEKENKSRAYGYCFHEELPWRLKNWKAFCIERFFIIEDENGNIIATAAPWTPGESQQIVLESLPPKVEALSWGVSKLSLKKWVRIPRPGEPVEVLYLTHFYISSALSPHEKTDALTVLIDSIYDVYRQEDWKLMTFSLFEEEMGADFLSGYLKYSIPLEVYSVHPTQENGEIHGKPLTGLPSIEAALI